MGGGGAPKNDALISKVRFAYAVPILLVCEFEAAVGKMQVLECSMSRFPRTTSFWTIVFRIILLFIGATWGPCYQFVIELNKSVRILLGSLKRFVFGNSFRSCKADSGIRTCDSVFTCDITR